MARRLFCGPVMLLRTGRFVGPVKLYDNVQNLSHFQD
jgi:hypothetical protein